MPYYPLPSNEGYEIFLKVMKKEQYSKTQYSLPFMLSLRDKFTDKPTNMREIKIPQKNEKLFRAPDFPELTWYLCSFTDGFTFSGGSPYNGLRIVQEHRLGLWLE